FTGWSRLKISVDRARIHISAKVAQESKKKRHPCLGEVCAKRMQPSRNAEGTRSAGVAHFRLATPLPKQVRYRERKTAPFVGSAQLAVRLRPAISSDPR